MGGGGVPTRPHHVTDILRYISWPCRFSDVPPVPLDDAGRQDSVEVRQHYALRAGIQAHRELINYHPRSEGTDCYPGLRCTFGEGILGRAYAKSEGVTVWYGDNCKSRANVSVSVSVSVLC